MDDAEIGRLVREAMVNQGDGLSAPTTDQDGNPLPRLDLDHPHTATSDPLLAVGYALLAELPEDWDAAVLTTTAAADEVKTWGIVKGRTAQFNRNLYYLPTVASACAALRRSTRDADGRAWYSVLIRLYRTGTMDVSYNFDDPPFLLWGPSEIELLRRDQELYPRDPQQLPDWHPSRP